MENLDYFLNERNLQVKRKYGKYDSISVGKNAPVRTSILGFIDSQDCCTKDAIDEYIDSNNEDISNKPISKGWVNRNSKYLVKYNDKEGKCCYKLSKLGKRVVSKTNINE